MIEWLPPVIGLLTVGGAMAGAFVYNKKQRERFERETTSFGDVAILNGPWPVGLGLVTTQGEPRTQSVAAGGGKNNPTRWDCTSSVPSLALRTTFHIDREGMLGALREKVGGHDIHTGDTLFDDTYCLRGSDADVVRAVFQQASVQHAVSELFGDASFRHVKLSADGKLYAWAFRRALEAHDARAKAMKLQALARALVDHSDRAPVPPPESPLRTSGVGGASGAPVGIPIGDRNG